ncbi:MAG TPA: ABC transporter ATP-binding protein [Bacilli bacterium]
MTEVDGLTDKLLTGTRLSKYFGGVKAVDDIDFSLREGELVGLIGPNGAGKSTVFNLLSGAIAPSHGTIHIRGVDMTGKKLFQFAEKGVARTFQNIRLFKGMTVFDNVLAGFHRELDTGFLHSIANFSSSRKKEQLARAKAEELLRAFGLYAHRNKLATHLSYGDQRRVEIARALAANPQILLLDEPAAGMNAYEGQELVKLIGDVWRNYHLSIVLVEHDMEVVMNLCQTIYVMDSGRLIFHGTPEAVRQSKVVREAYLGGDLDA